MGVREYWRLDPEGTLMGSSLEGYEASGGKYDPVRPVASGERDRWFRSRVLGLELRSRRQARATVLVFRDPRTGEETDGALEESERRRRIAERDARAAKQRASAADERVRELEEQLRALTANTTPSEPDR